MCRLVAFSLGNCEGRSDKEWEMEGSTEAGLDIMGWEPPLGGMKQELSQGSISSLVTAEPLYYNIQ